VENLKNAVIELIEDHGRIDAAEVILQNRELALYVIDVGVNKILALERRLVRREMKNKILPHEDIKYTERGAINFSAQTMKRVNSHHKEFMRRWYIGGLSLGNLTKEELLAEAAKEKKAGHGHFMNASIYEILAKPLQPGQRMRDYWTEEDARRATGGAGGSPVSP
jgi:hypothetical protein